MFFRWMKLALHFSHLRLGPIDPVVIELLREEERRLKNQVNPDNVTRLPEVAEKSEITIRKAA